MTRHSKARLARNPLAHAIGAALGLSLWAGAALAQDGHQYQALADAEQWDFLNEYCTSCHNFEDYSGGLDMTTLFLEDVPQDADVWEMALRKLKSRMMPPPGQPTPSEERNAEFVAWLEGYLDEAGAQHELSETAAIHRLNRKEYANAVRDLFALNINPAEILPVDNTKEGFDNIADALQVSPVFINQYVSAARAVVEQAVGDKSPGLGSTVYRPSEVIPNRALGGGRQQFHVPGLPLGTRGGMLVEHWFPADGEYAVSVGDWDLSVWLYNIEFDNTMIVTVDGEKVAEVELGGADDLEILDVDQTYMEQINRRTKDLRFSTSAGPHKVGVTFVRRSHAESDDRLEHFIPDAIQDRVLSIPSVEVRGPYNPAGIAGSTPARDRIFSCYPSQSSEEAACAEEIISTIVTRAYRRPLNEQDKAPLMDFYQRGLEAGGFEEGVRQALTRALASPNFLYRAEIAPEGVEPGEVYDLPSLDLASRLSFFLWSSIPDDELLQLAIDDRLKEPDVLRAQVQRMLADPKASTLASNFAYQWLRLGKLDEISPDIDIFPYASGPGDLRGDFVKEIELFVDSIIRADRSVLDLLDADHSFLNERLALHYGIHDVKGNRFREVALDNPDRWGLLGKGGVLMATSYPNRTSPVLRGAWILEILMGTPPPVPPPNVEALPESAAGKPLSTVRERLEQHRANPACNSCHAVMDPLGFALDNFDATGHWRDIDRYTRTLVDPSGVLPNGQPVNGPQDLREALLGKPEMFAQAITEKLMTYALGRTVEAHDMPVVRGIVRKAAADDYRFSSIIMQIIESDAFSKKVAPQPASMGTVSGLARGEASD